MTIAERLRLIPLIAGKLAEQEPGIIYLTLEQFGLPVSSRSGRGSRADFIIKKIRMAPDDVLVDLARHLELPVDALGIRSKAAFWKEGRLKLFISHLAKRKETATELRETLEKMGISSFVAHNDITPSKEWQNEIEAALHTCDAVVALMVEGFHKSYWTDQEIGFAFGRGLPVIPVNMGESPYGFIAKIQAYKFKDVPALADTIFKVLLGDPRTTRKMSHALVEQFATSNSFASASQNLRLLAKLKYWDDALLDKLKMACRKNDQVKGSFDVPEGVQALIRKVREKKKVSSLLVN